MSMTNPVVTKFIITDDFKPMYAMRDINGPQNGPLRTPVRVPIKILERLLKQDNGPRIFEVVPEGKTFSGNVIYSDRVQLTLDNYKLSYYDIVGTKAPVPAEVINITPKEDDNKDPKDDEPEDEDEHKEDDKTPPADEQELVNSETPSEQESVEYTIVSVDETDETPDNLLITEVKREQSNDIIDTVQATNKPSKRRK